MGRRPIRPKAWNAALKIMKSALPAFTVACLVACSTPGALAADLNATSFSDPTLLSYGQSPLVSHAADLDLDGRVDLIVGHANGVAILKNQSSGDLSPGSFPSAVILPVSGSVFNIASGDVNGDGKTDLVVTKTGGVVIFENRSTGSLDLSSFAPGVELLLHGSSNAGDLALTDLDQDGKLDLLVVDHDGSQILVLRNLSGAGAIEAASFSTPTSLGTAVGPNNLVLTDLDLAGGPDLAVIADGGLSVFRNTSTAGSISMVSVGMFVGDVGPLGITAADLDGDLKPELIIPTYFNFGISILHNTSSAGNIAFNSRSDLNTGDFPRSVAAADLNRDGRTDLVVAHELGTTLTLLQNNHVSGSFSGANLSATDLFPGSEPIHLITSDLNQDGKLDLVVTFSQAGSVGLLQNNLDLPPVPPVTNSPPISTNTPPVIETNVPPVIETNLPPVIETNLPPVVVTNPPPVIETNLPPVVVTNPPPVIETNLPPVVVTNPPPVIETNLPPIIETNTPPVITNPPVNLPPVANAGADATIEATGSFTSVTLNGSLSNDPEGATLAWEWFKGGVSAGTGTLLNVSLPVGRHEFLMKVTDPLGAISEDTVVITVQDTIAPQVMRISATPNRINSANHKMVRVEIRLVVEDAVDSAPRSRIVSVHSSENLNGRGDGNTAVDWMITGDLSLRLRAERSGPGVGRVYTVKVATTDAAGNTTTSDVLVRVSKSNRK